MTRNIVLIFMIFLSIPILAACGSGAPAQATILPEDCRMTVRQEMLLTMDGLLPPKAIVRWAVDQGDISFVVTSAEAVFVAPSEPMVVTITALITPTPPGMETPIKRQCIVTSLNTAPSGLVKADRLEGSFNSWLQFPDNLYSLNTY